MGSIDALYMKPIENTSFFVSPHRNLSNLCVSWTEAKRCRSSFHDANRGPTKSRLMIDQSIKPVI
jgi:hypothetical protein